MLQFYNVEMMFQVLLLFLWSYPILKLSNMMLQAVLQIRIQWETEPFWSDPDPINCPDPDLTIISYTLDIF